MFSFNRSFAATIDSKVDLWAVNLAIDSNKYLATIYGKLLHDCQMRDELIDENKKRNYAFS